MTIITIDADIDLNPRVKQIIKEAIEAAKPFWIGLTTGGVEQFSRLSTYFDHDGSRYFNINQMMWGAARKYHIDGCTLAKSANGPVQVSGPLLRPCDLNPGDAIVLPVGGVIVTGQLP